MDERLIKTWAIRWDDYVLERLRLTRRKNTVTELWIYQPPYSLNLHQGLTAFGIDLLCSRLGCRCLTLAQGPRPIEASRRRRVQGFRV